MCNFSSFLVAFACLTVVNATDFKPESLDQLRNAVDTCVKVSDDAPTSTTQVRFGILSTAKIARKVLQSHKMSTVHAERGINH